MEERGRQIRENKIRERDKERRQIEIRDLETGSRYDKRKGKNREAREIEKGYEIRE